MRVPVLAALAAAAAAATVPPRDSSSGAWQVTDFFVGSHYDRPTAYHLDVSDGFTKIHCYAQNEIFSSQCPGAAVPAAFSNTTCSSPWWSWSLSSIMSPTQPPQPGFSLEIAYNEPGSPGLYACEFIFDNVNCTTDPRNAEKAKATLNAGPSFGIQYSTFPECIFA